MLKDCIAEGSGYSLRWIKVEVEDPEYRYKEQWSDLEN